MRITNGGVQDGGGAAPWIVLAGNEWEVLAHSHNMHIQQRFWLADRATSHVWPVPQMFANSIALWLHLWAEDCITTTEVEAFLNRVATWTERTQV